MSADNTHGDRRQGLGRLFDRLTPRAGVRPQLFSAALVWAIGGVILVVRGAMYLVNRAAPHAWLLGLGLALIIAVPKSRYVMGRVARKAVARILHRDHACYFGFFSWKSWLFVLAMMGGGIMLRKAVGVGLGDVGSGIMGALYLGIGSALLFADRIFWFAAIRSLRESISEVEHDLEVEETPKSGSGTAGTRGEDPQ